MGKKVEIVSEPIAPPTEGAITTMADRAGFLIPASWTQEVDATGVVTTMPMATPADRARVLNLMSGQSIPFQDVYDTPLQVIHVTAWSYLRVSEETGEETPAVKLALICQDGRVITTDSPFVRHTLLRVMGMVRRPPWNPPITLIPRAMKSKRGRMYHTIECDEGI